MGFPLFLTAMIGARQFWALNPRHLELLGDYLGASLRERTLVPHNMTMMARLPVWLKASGARADVVAAIKRLQADAVRAGLT